MNVCCRLKSDLSRHTKNKLIKRTFNLKNFSVKQSQRKLLAFDTTRQRLTNNNNINTTLKCKKQSFIKLSS
jgi:hypothetical protein